ncbi:alcohol oxidase [Gymnopus androsaceus JB14]|uniref:Alcohol oxidase n=1 Tax=Gymnopus androsaceus JB14 TaxID=1447944 RepID=A0A6A4IJN0_9AGAR|nr:alcohol oxidase [Gymnopus androsaceus JB14]
MPLVSVDEVAGYNFDFILIGGGTAGLTLASRLSENAEWSILVLEAGNAHLDDHPLISRPSQYGLQFANPEYDWAFKTVPQKFSNNLEYLWSRGKGLGGSSAMNFSVWTLPPKEDIDNWEKLGNPGWNWDNFEKYSRKAVTYVPLELEKGGSEPVSVEAAFSVWDASKARGDGPIFITHPRQILDVDLKLYQASETFLNMGLPKSRAPYHGDCNGTYLNLNNVHPTLHSRTYSIDAIQIRPLGKTKPIYFDSVDGDLEASGVEFYHGPEKKLYQASAAEGSNCFSWILELSGIGRPEVLTKLGVKVKVPLDGVGENVQEHIWTGCSFKLKDDYEHDTYDILKDPVQLEKHMGLYSKGQGLFSTGIVTMAGMPLRTITSDAEKLYAAEEARIRQDIQEGKYPPGLAEQYEIQLQYANKGALDCELLGVAGNSVTGRNPPLPGKKYYSIGAFLNHNFSRGTIHCLSSDPHEPPAIDPHYFERDIDLQIFIKTIRYVREITKKAPLKDILSDDPASMELNPGAEIQTDEQIANWLKQCLSTTWHTTGSLSMLPKDKNGVVDPTLKVYGTKNIRVVDVSIIPLQFAAHTQATAYIIAEQGLSSALSFLSFIAAHRSLNH